MQLKNLYDEISDEEPGVSGRHKCAFSIIVILNWISKPERKTRIGSTILGTATNGSYSRIFGAVWGSGALVTHV